MWASRAYVLTCFLHANRRRLRSKTLFRRRRRQLQDKSAEVGVLGEVADVLLHIVGIDPHRLAVAVRSREGDFVEHALHDGLQAPRADVFDGRIDGDGDIGQRIDRAVGDVQSDALGPHSATYCLISEASGSVRMRRMSSRVSACSSTRIGRRPCSSGSRSDGFAIWKAPEAMNRM